MYVVIVAKSNAVAVLVLEYDEAGADPIITEKESEYRLCRCSSVVEHVIGNDGVVSPILISGTINKKRHPIGCLFFINSHRR